MLGILKYFVVLLFNVFLESKYRLKVLLNYRITQVEIEIKNVYAIERESGKKIQVDCKQLIHCLNEKIKYSHHIILNNLVNHFLKNLDSKSYLLEIDYKKYGKDYLLNLEMKQDMVPIIFPFYNLIELKKKNMNKIMFMESEDNLNDERLKLLEKYGGPFNDFYRSKGLGIPLLNIYSAKYEKFLFRGVNIKMEDTFLNEYEINSDNVGDVLCIQGSLDESKLSLNKESEKYILSNYKHFNVAPRQMIRGVIEWIFGKVKEE